MCIYLDIYPHTHTRLPQILHNAHSQEPFGILISCILHRWHFSLFKASFWGCGEHIERWHALSPNKVHLNYACSDYRHRIMVCLCVCVYVLVCVCASFFSIFLSQFWVFISWTYGRVPENKLQTFRVTLLFESVSSHNACMYSVNVLLSSRSAYMRV